MVRINSGKYRHIVTFQKLKTANDSYGENSVNLDLNWEDTFTTRVGIFPISGREYLTLDENMRTSEISHRIVMRYMDGIDSDMRIKFGYRIFEIISPPINAQERDREIVLFVKEKEVKPTGYVPDTTTTEPVAEEPVTTEPTPTEPTPIKEFAKLLLVGTSSTATTNTINYLSGLGHEVTFITETTFTGGYDYSTFDLIATVRTNAVDTMNSALSDAHSQGMPIMMGLWLGTQSQAFPVYVGLTSHTKYVQAQGGFEHTVRTNQHYITSQYADAQTLVLNNNFTYHQVIDMNESVTSGLRLLEINPQYTTMLAVNKGETLLTGALATGKLLLNGYLYDDYPPNMDLLMNRSIQWLINDV